MIKKIFWTALILQGVMAGALVWGGQDEEDLGIKMKQGKQTDLEAAKKGKTISSKYEKAKSRLLGETKTTDKKEKKKDNRLEKKFSSLFKRPRDKNNHEPLYTVLLNNGQSLRGITIVKKEGDGFWIDLDGGKVYLKQSEVKKILPDEIKGEIKGSLS